MNCSRPRRLNISKPKRYQTTSSEEGEVETSGKETQMDQSNSQINDDVNDLREVLENDSAKDMHANSNPPINYTPPTSYVTNTNPYYIQPQTSNPNFTSHAPGYTPLLDANMTHSNNSQQSINFTQNYNNPPQTITQAPHTSTSQKHINSGFNTHAYDPKFQGSNNFWPNESHRQNFLQSSQTSGEYYNIKPEIQALHGRIDLLALEMKKIHQKLDKILLQTSKKHQKHTTEKPEFLPVSSIEDVQRFEAASEEEYTTLVNYLIFIGGFNLKESINLCTKEVFQPQLMSSYTWFGRENQRPLFNTRLIKAIYDAVCENKNFEKPMRATFQTVMRDAVRTAKQRHRNQRNNLDRAQRGQDKRGHDLWTNEYVGPVAHNEAIVRNEHEDEDEMAQSEGTEEN